MTPLARWIDRLTVVAAVALAIACNYYRGQLNLLSNAVEDYLQIPHMTTSRTRTDSLLIKLKEHEAKTSALEEVLASKTAQLATANEHILNLERALAEAKNTGVIDALKKDLELARAAQAATEAELDELSDAVESLVGKDEVPAEPVVPVEPVVPAEPTEPAPAEPAPAEPVPAEPVPAEPGVPAEPTEPVADEAPANPLAE